MRESEAIGVNQAEKEVAVAALAQGGYYTSAAVALCVTQPSFEAANDDDSKHTYLDPADNPASQYSWLPHISQGGCIIIIKHFCAETAQMGDALRLRMPAICQSAVLAALILCFQCGTSRAISVLWKYVMARAAGHCFFGALRNSRAIEQTQTGSIPNFSTDMAPKTALCGGP